MPLSLTQLQSNFFPPCQNVRSTMQDFSSSLLPPSPSPATVSSASTIVYCVWCHRDTRVLWIGIRNGHKMHMKFDNDTGMNLRRINASKAIENNLRMKSWWTRSKHKHFAILKRQKTRAGLIQLCREMELNDANNSDNIVGKVPLFECIHAASKVFLEQFAVFEMLKENGVVQSKSGANNFSHYNRKLSLLEFICRVSRSTWTTCRFWKAKNKRAFVASVLQKHYDRNDWTVSVCWVNIRCSHWLIAKKAVNQKAHSL